jgi:hypothetical protein
VLVAEPTCLLSYPAVVAVAMTDGSSVAIGLVVLLLMRKFTAAQRTGIAPMTF